MLKNKHNNNNIMTKKGKSCYPVPLKQSEQHTFKEIDYRFLLLPLTKFLLLPSTNGKTYE